MSVEELAEAISRFVNGASPDKMEQLAKLMAKDHPTLQQSKMRLACLFVEEMANKPHVDARNLRANKTAKAMVQGYKADAKQEIIEQDGCISDSLAKYIENEAIPSKSLPTI